MNSSIIPIPDRSSRSETAGKSWNPKLLFALFTIITILLSLKVLTMPVQAQTPESSFFGTLRDKPGPMNAVDAPAFGNGEVNWSIVAPIVQTSIPPDLMHPNGVGFNSEPGTFAGNILFQTNSRPEQVLAADLHRDSDTDLVTGHSSNLVWLRHSSLAVNWPSQNVCENGRVQDPIA